MNNSAKLLYSKIRLISRVAISIAIALSLIFNHLISTSNISWQISLAFIALALGIPHGAIDHLISIPRNSKGEFFTFILIYVAIAGLALAFILKWNLLGFQIVILMSAIHFGIGDLTFICESDQLSSRKIMSRVSQLLYLISAGFMPVFIPLLQSKSKSALESINPLLANWAGSNVEEIKMGVIFFAGVTFLVLISQKRYQEILDLLLLSGLSFFAPPLIAFAFYFGLWHALRHTARLTLLLPEAKKALENGDIPVALRKVFLPGLPALVGSLVASGIIFILGNNHSDKTIFWSLLALVWALTVPHMLATFRFDLATIRTAK